MEPKALLVVVCVLAVSYTHAQPAGPPSTPLEKAFSHRPTIESIIACFIGNSKCNPQQEKIKVQALATMRNFGTCPDDVCSPQERIEMERAMELLQSEHSDLWARLIFSVLGIDIGDFGKRR